MALKNTFNIRMIEGTQAELTADTTVYATNVFLYATDIDVLKKGNGTDVYTALTQINQGTEV